ncbi:hypothetical protein ACIGW4_21525 [Streptomyces sp. NPDC053513]|uniref:Integral membrane protein n=1 Tax=Streptomyces litmocidini TaxID=67318 RepID=A0ABW7UKZ3_9ACTN|nr:hypothetical protein [Streptomyces sp. PanSC19]
MVRRRVPLVTLALLACGLAAGGLWWWAVLRLLLVPGESGPVEGTVAAGGWGLSLLPVHVAASSGRRGTGGSGGRTGDTATVTGRGVAGAGAAGPAVTRASRRRRWGGGSGRS